MIMRCFKALVLSLVVAAFAPVVAQAGLIINLVEQSNGTLLFTYSGAINLASLGSPVVANYNQGSAMLSPSQGFIRLGSLVDLYATGSSSPTSTFGSGGAIAPTSVEVGSSAFSVDFVAKTISVPTGYISSSPIAGSATFSGSFASNGINPGTYVYSWGSSTTESVTLNATPASPVPEPATLWIFAIGTAVSSMVGRNRARKDQAVDRIAS